MKKKVKKDPELTELVRARVTAEVHDKLLRVAARCKRTPSALARLYIEEKLAEEED